MRKHMKLMVQGTYAGPGSGTPPENLEVWAFNIRQALVFGTVSDLADFPDTWDVVPEFASATETHWTTTTTWKATQSTHTFEPMDYLTDYVCPSLVVFMGSTGISNIVKLSSASLYPCDETGNSIGGNVATASFTTGYYGAGSGHPLPLENSIVTSWGTDRLGRRGRGRIFGPVPGVSAINVDGLLESTVVADVLAKSVGLIEGMAFSGLTGDDAHVKSVVTGPGPVGNPHPYGDYAVINKARVGQVVDTQRRRRNKEPEAYVSSAVSQ